MPEPLKNPVRNPRRSQAGPGKPSESWAGTGKMRRNGSSESYDVICDVYMRLKNVSEPPSNSFGT